MGVMTADAEISPGLPDGLETVRAAVTGQARRLAEATVALDETALLLPSRMPGWRVHEVLVHLASSMNRLSRAVREPEARVRQVSFEEYCTASHSDAEEIRLRVLEEAAAVSPAGSGRLLAEAARSLTRRLEMVESDKLVVMRRGTMALSDVLAVHCLEMLTHGADLGRDLGRPPLDLCDATAVRYATSLLHGPAVWATLNLLDGPAVSASWVRRLCPAVA